MGIYIGAREGDTDSEGGSYEDGQIKGKRDLCMQVQVFWCGVVFFLQVDEMSHSVYGQLFLLYVSGALEVKGEGT